MRADLTGVVLAGGAGRRMGADKALIDIDGRPLLWRVAERLSLVCVTVLVAPGSRPLPDLPWNRVDDRETGQGPFAGILGALAVAATPLVAVAAVDMPHVDPALFTALADRWQGQAAVVPVVDGRLQPLHAVYAVSALPRLSALFDEGERSVSAAVRDVGALRYQIDGPVRWSDNLNTPDDLRRLLDER